jgi:ATP-dependent helicase HepA
LEDGAHGVVAELLSDGSVRLTDGRIVRPDELWPLQVKRSLFERLAEGDVDAGGDLRVRLKSLQFLSTRQADGLGPFLGGRVRLFPHQLYVAERATAGDPVRWLLADEVGLGKTIEACLILNKLVHAGTVERCVVVAPQSLTVQWLGELWRKYHQVFTLLDNDRLGDVARDFGADFNPFDVHRRVVVALETLIEQPHLTSQAVAAGIDLLVVDEAQRLKRPPGHPGEPGWRAVAPIAALGRHVLLLTATPLEDDAHGFFRLLQLLRPEEFPDDLPPEGGSRKDRNPGAVWLPLLGGRDRKNALPPCTSSTRRTDIGGLPPRVGLPVDAGGSGADVRQQLEAALRAAPAPHVVAKRQQVERIQRALSSAAALSAALGSTDGDLRRQAEAMDTNDPRLRWLLANAPAWREAKEKTLIFVAYVETLEMIRTALSHRAQLASGLFHEGLSLARRDMEVARFREADGPSLLVSTESGGEGRNFEFCRRLVLFDLPWKPTVVEQRIGRLDRIGRRDPVEIIYFRPPAGIGADVVRLYETLGVFREPLAGLEPQLAHVEDVVAAIAADPDGSLTDERRDQLLDEARAARTRIREAAYQELHRDPYRAAMAEQILARVPPDLDALVESFVVDACTRLGFKVDRLGGRRRFAIEFGNEALVDSLPGVPGGATFVGTFDREEAVQDEMIDFFASGHALVEGLLAFIEDSPGGRVGKLQVTIPEQRGVGVAAFYTAPEHRATQENVVASGFTRKKTAFDVLVIDSTGRLRPQWAAAFYERPLPVAPLSAETSSRVDWSRLMRLVEKEMSGEREPYAVVGLVVRPR